MTMAESVKKYSGIDYYAWENDEQARKECEARGVHVEANAVKGECLEACFDEFVEKNLIQPDSSEAEEDLESMEDETEYTQDETDSQENDDSEE